MLKQNCGHDTETLMLKQNCGHDREADIETEFVVMTAPRFHLQCVLTVFHYI